MGENQNKDFEKINFIEMGDNANDIADNIANVINQIGVGDWRDAMAEKNCLALKICAIIQLCFVGLTLISTIVSAIRRKEQSASAAVGSSLGITNLVGIGTPCLGIAAMY